MSVEYHVLYLNSDKIVVKMKIKYVAGNLSHDCDMVDHGVVPWFQ